MLVFEDGMLVFEDGMLVFEDGMLVFEDGMLLSYEIIAKYLFYIIIERWKQLEKHMCHLPRYFFFLKT